MQERNRNCVAPVEAATALSNARTPNGNQRCIVAAAETHGTAARGRERGRTAAMPARTKRYCLEPGCGALTDKGRCDEHERGSAWQRGYKYDWLIYSRRFRKRYPLCGMGPRWPTPKREGAPAGCLAKGKLTGVAKGKPHHVDHIVPVKRAENPTLFWDPMKHQTLCQACHFEKGKSERG